MTLGARSQNRTRLAARHRLGQTSAPKPTNFSSLHPELKRLIRGSASNSSQPSATGKIDNHKEEHTRIKSTNYTMLAIRETLISYIVRKANGDTLMANAHRESVPWGRPYGKCMEGSSTEPTTTATPRAKTSNPMTSKTCCYKVGCCTVL